MADVTVSFGCVALRVKNTIAGIEPEPFEELQTFEKVEYLIKDLQAARGAPGTLVLGVQRLGKGKSTRYVLFRDRAAIDFSHERDVSLQAVQWFFKVRLERTGAKPGTGMVSYHGNLQDLNPSTLAAVPWKMLLKVEKSGGAKIHRLYYIQPQGGSGGDPCRTPGLDCSNPQTPEEFTICLVNGC